MTRKKGGIVTYDKHLDGVYGISKTLESHCLEYFLVSMKICDIIDNLQTALDALSYSKLDFDELVQRDVDYERVDKKIIGNYLLQGSGNVIFFPPLIAALVEVDDGVPLKNYPIALLTEEPDYRNWGHAICKNWGNKFRLSFLTEDMETEWEITCNKKKYYYNNYNVSLDFLSKYMKLIVVDGQHRFMALKRLYENRDKRLLLDEMNVPVCIFLPSGATKESSDSETIIRDMRQLFVTINTEAQKVSGHFRDLLNDKKISCECVRQLANFWKHNPENDDNKSLLHLLEWNQREDKLANQRTSIYSVTTVSIIVGILDKIFKDFGVLKLLLHGTDRDKLDVIVGISNDDFDVSNLALIKSLILNNIVPALDILFRTPLPYANIENAFSTILLEYKNKTKVLGVNGFLKRLFEFQRLHIDYDSNEAIEIEKTFNKKIQENISQDNQYYFTNVFQTGFLLCWAELYHLIYQENKNISPKEVADLYVDALNLFAFNPEKKLFSPESNYTQELLFDGFKVLPQEYSKIACKNLIASSLHPSIEYISRKKPELGKLIDKYANDNLEEYKDALETRRVNNLSKRWRLNDIMTDDEKEKFKNVSDDRRKLEGLCFEYLAPSINKSIDVLLNILEI